MESKKQSSDGSDIAIKITKFPADPTNGTAYQANISHASV